MGSHYFLKYNSKFNRVSVRNPGFLLYFRLTCVSTWIDSLHEVTCTNSTSNFKCEKTFAKNIALT